MQGVVVNVLGQPPKYQSFPDPEPGEGEVLLHVSAAGLHPLWWLWPAAAPVRHREPDHSILPGMRVPRGS